MTLLSLFENYFIVIILRSIYYRYSKIISLLLLFDFNSRENRNSYFIKISSLCARELYYYYSIFIIRLTILLSLFDAHFNYSTLILFIRRLTFKKEKRKKECKRC